MRRDVDITRDLLQLAIDSQWAGQTNIACHCHPDYRKCCLACEELERDGNHKPDCSVMVLIIEAKAYLEAENELVRSKPDFDYDDLIDIPT